MISYIRIVTIETYNGLYFLKDVVKDIIKDITLEAGTALLSFCSGPHNAKIKFPD